MSNRHPHESASIEEEIELRTRANPAYRDTPIGRGEVRLPDPERTHRRPIPSRNDRPLMWRLLGVPSPRELVRALVIDGYPRTLHRWAFGRVGAAVAWTCVAFGMFAAAGSFWFLDAIGIPPRLILIAIIGLGIACIGVAAIAFLPILRTIRYANRWRAGMQEAERS